MSEKNFDSFGYDDIDESSDGPGLVEMLMKYLFYWKYFVASIFVCVAVAYVYSRFLTPTYEISSWVYIDEGDKKSQSQTSPLAAIQDLGMLSMTNNFENEVVRFKSQTLIEKVVNDLQLYIQLYEPSTFKYDLPVYKKTPLQVYMTPQEASQLEGGVKLEMNYTKEVGLKVEATYTVKKEKQKIENTFAQLPAVLTTPVGVITISSTKYFEDTEEPIELLATISSPVATAMAYSQGLSVEPYSKNTTVAILSIKNSIKERGIDFINCLVDNYNNDTNDEKNEVAQKTAEFIQDRIGIINGELGSTETQLADFKRKSGLTNLKSDAELALQENSKYEQQRTENATQIRLVQFLRNYIYDPANKEEVLPANVGLKDQGLTSVIDQYNTMIIERKRLLRTSSENNPAVIHLNTGIEAMRHNVMTTVASVLKGLEIAQADIARQASKFEARISNAPTQEKEYMSISRQQEIQAALYIMLLEKREENAITLASTAKNGRIIQKPMSGLYPVAPKKKMILLVAFALGVAIPVGCIALYDMTRYKIEGREDVEELTKIPIVGELPKSQVEPVEGAIMLRENKNDIMEESFRSFRTNLLFMLEPSEKVILFTSTMPGEGKSFIAGNLATSMAYLGKKVLVMGLDIRKPGLNKVFSLNKHAKGITDYMVNPDQVDLFSLIQHSDFSSNLDILVGGTIPPNPTELVARDSLQKALELLKKHYDYILLDTAPISMVTDTHIISRLANMCVYICSVDLTPKSEFTYVNKLQTDAKFPKLAVAINGLDLTKRKYGYGKYGYGKYGYGKYGYGKYGYGKHYGYGYGYGYEKEK